VLLVGVVCEVAALKTRRLYGVSISLYSSSPTFIFDNVAGELLGPSINGARPLAIVLALSGSLLGWVDAANRPRIFGILLGVAGLIVALDVASLS
jgi:hypothetical protein